MRWLQATATCLGALATSACAPVSEQYFREGVGVTLNSGQLAQSTQLQDEYVHYICQQAGGFNLETAVGQSCDVSWTAFTMAGMNDIDQRCDAYLDWLDAQRRDRTPVLAQIAAMGAATSGIMGVAGAGTQAIAIVATAFGLAGQSYANWNSRLLLDVDHSTVQAVVYGNQVQYREDNASLIGTVADRPNAIYLLRSYLRLCMPITIETNINNTVTLVQKGVSPSDIQPLVQSVPSSFTSDDSSVALQRIIAANPANRQKLNNIMAENPKIFPGIPRVVSTIMWSPEGKIQRLELLSLAKSQGLSLK